MGSQGTHKNRHYLLCPICKKTQAILSVHLRRVCMKKATPKAITSVLDKAKSDVLEILQFGRIFSYDHLHRILNDPDSLSRLIEELERHHMVVTNDPPLLINTDINIRPSTRTTTQPPLTQETSEEVSSDETSPCNTDTNPRMLMAEKGLYKKHSLDDSLLKDFATHLEKDLHNENFKQEVENVARFLYYMNPKEPSLLFVKNRQKTKQYMSELSDAKLTKSTQLNYLKSLKRFLTYHTMNTNLEYEDERLHDDCKLFIKYIGSLQKRCSDEEITKKRNEILIQKNSLTPQDCWAVLLRAKKDFMAVMDKIFPKVTTTPELTECAFVVYYLEALLILKYLQRPGVVEHMTVKEWRNRQRDESGIVVSVKEHKRASYYKMASFVLTQEEESWFDLYFKHVRPKLLSFRKVKRTRDHVEAEDRFFVSTSGKPIYNASNDLKRLHSKYQLQSVTSQMARKVFETAAKTSCEHNSMKGTLQKLISKMAGDLSDRDYILPTVCDKERDAVCGSNTQMDVQAAYNALLQTHPVTLDGQVPDKEVRMLMSPTFHRQLYERWLKAQMKLRVQHVISHFGRRLPSENRVSSWILKQDWKSNIPTPARIINEWKPSGLVETAMDLKSIRRLVRSQKWKGLAIADIEAKGKGIIVTRFFQAGEVVCDYHGRVVTAKEGLQIHHNTSEEETGFMFFYENSKDQHMCIDAHSAYCECHPDKETFGRLINHSRKRANLQPRSYTVESDGKERDVILFIASRNIDVNEELLFDYGMQKKSFRGEGLDLCWL
ncbi:uncharacterized protein [Misgurnus anguillicaudatus]|uniref:uncharacterized protein n=1 Tax=Misgurnus anguillicaudatus TaxID=75329 RepID=UPI003CCF6CD6